LPVCEEIRAVWPRCFLIVLAVCALGLADRIAGSTSDAWAQRSQRPVTAPQGQASTETHGESPSATGEPTLPADAVTSHTLTLNGQKLDYTARVGTLPLADGKGSKTAEIFYVAFTRDGADRAKRPITFAMNGGPGAASAYLDMVAIGPRILDFGDGRKLPPAHAKAIDNPDSWLDFTDLVFIDPVGTGYSIPTTGEQDAQKNFFGVRADLEALSSAIRLVLTKLDRYASPIYLTGESYGGFRAARLPVSLSQNEGIAVSGIILLSPILEFSLLRGDDFNPLPWAFRLPSYAAVNVERHNTLIPQSLKDAESFALGDYLAALIAPAGHSARSATVYGAVAKLIGIPQADVERWHGRVPTGVFAKEIHRDEAEVASRYDGSVAGPDPAPSAPTSNRDDPILAALTAPLTAGFILYLRDELQFKTDRQYVLLNDDLGRKWNWGGRGRDGAGATSDLARALALDPQFKGMIVSGMTDLVAPYLMNRYVIDHMPTTVTRDRITIKLYPGGHMMYLRPGSRASLHADARALVGSP
jgi:carboxypeptidase C (cathepsin A)